MDSSADPGKAPLLTTKLYVPPPRPNRVPRAGLVERLSLGLNIRRILISGPAGFGKTTLLSTWLMETRISAAWISLDAGDNDPVRFFSYLLAALRMVEPDVGREAEHSLHSVHPPSLEAATTLLINALCELKTPLILVLDDYHAVENPTIHHLVGVLLDRLPPALCLVLATRADPPLPLARWRSRGQLVEIRADDLRFTPEEAALFLNGVMGLALTPEEVAALEMRTEGWIAGLQMAALSMQGSRDVGAFVRAFSGSHRYILDYLVEEVLGGQPESVQSFLVQTAILERLSGPLCDALLGSPPGTGQGTLEGLESANLFIVPLDDERGWYRYHHLFADLLRARLRQSQPALIPELHRRAFRWYEQQGLFFEAIHHALAAGEFAAAAALIEQNSPSLHSRGEITTLMIWVEALPMEIVRRQPLLAVTRAWAALFNGALETMESLLAAIDAALAAMPPGPVAQVLQGQVLTLRAFAADRSGDFARAGTLAGEADALIPESDMTARCLLSYILGREARLQGDLTRAELIDREMRRTGEVADNNLTMALALTECAAVYKLRGELNRAEAFYREGMVLAGQAPHNFGRVDVSIDRVIADLMDSEWAELFYERNTPDEAQRRLEAVISRFPAQGWWSIPMDFPSIYALLARAQQAQGAGEAALATLEMAERQFRQHKITPRFNSLIETTRVRLWLAQGRLAEAGRWADRAGDPDVPFLLREQEDLVRARVRLAQGQWEEALGLLEALAAAADAGGRGRSGLEARWLQALGLAARGDMGRALGGLEEVLRRAEPEGYVRGFVDEGASMAALLAELARRPGMASWDYLTRLLAAFPAPMRVEPAVSPGGENSGVDPLSDRELEVLQLLAAGCSNQEIADRLFVTVGTVKTHIHHIHGKLDAQNRTQAVARARALGLL